MGNLFSSFHGNTSRQQNTRFEGNPLTHDPERFKLMDHYMSHNEVLRVGDVTFGWVYHALRACARVRDPDFLKAIQTPCLLALAGEESIVDNAVVRKASEHLSHCKLVEFEGALHEILMEKDDIRDSFFQSFHGAC